MAPTKHTDISAVWAALAQLIDELTKLAKNANRAIDEDRERLAAKGGK